MKRLTFTFILCCIISFSYAQVASDFGDNDVLICNFEDVNPTVVDSLWTDSLMTTPITSQSANITIEDNPFPIENESASAAKYIRPKGEYKSLFIRFDKAIDFSKTPYLQVQVYPIAGKSPTSSSVTINVANDKGDVVTGAGSMSNLPQDEWTTVTAFFGRLKPSALYNTVQISINETDSLSNLGGTEYYIDQIGFKAPDDGSVLPSTIFYETFGGYNDPWESGLVDGQFSIPNADESATIGPGEIGTIEGYASVDGITSGIPFTFTEADTNGAFWVRTWAMTAKYEGASGNGRMCFPNFRTGILETGDIDVSGFTAFNLSFGFGTQEWWPYQAEIASTRPKVEISVDGGDFYEIFSESSFLQSTGEFVDLGWGEMEKFEDEIFVMVEYPFTNIDGTAEIDSANTVNIRMSYKAGKSFWIDDLWFSGEILGSEEPVDPGTNIKEIESKTFNVFPNPASDFINFPYSNEVKITDINGREILSVFNTSVIDVSSFNKGVYVVHIQDGKSIETSVFIKR